MSEPWFDPIQYAWIPGTALGALGAIFGTLGGILGPRGKAKRLVFGFIGFALAYSAAMLVAGLVALAVGQPYGVWYGLLLPGVLGLVVFGANTPVVVYAYRMAEKRRMEAQDLEP
jgi:hypothetical protein